jgi:DNA-binding MarR family transcriptional regulator
MQTTGVNPPGWFVVLRGFAVVEGLKHEDRFGSVDPVLAPLALAFKRMVTAVERETGVAGLKWFILTRLAREDGRSQGEVSRYYEMDPSRVTRTAQAMEGEGLIRRERDPEDNRVVRMYLTAEGRHVLEKRPALNKKLQGRINAVLDEKELGELRRMLGVATSATQFVRSLGSTVGTAVIGSIMTKGYADNLAANAPSGAPDRLVGALENPQALVSDEARQALERAASAFPGGNQVVGQLVATARVALSDSVHDGFLFVLVSVLGAVFVALAMKNVRLAEQPTAVPAEQPVPAGEVGAATVAVTASAEDTNGSRDASLIPRLARAFREDPAQGRSDEMLTHLLLSVNGMETPEERNRAASALLGVANRLEHGSEDYPSPGRGGAGERERRRTRASLASLQDRDPAPPRAAAGGSLDGKGEADAPMSHQEKASAKRRDETGGERRDRRLC